MEWKNIYRGLLMGASDVIPGVSGGTIALLLGIYDRLIAAINGFLSKDWKKHLGFLIPLGLGVGIAVVSLSQVIKWLLDHYPVPLHFFFLGLILGVLPYLFKQADARHTFKRQHIILLVMGAALIGSIAFFNTSEGPVIETMTLRTYGFLFLSGFIGSVAMILPGISGSLILLVIGSYSTIMAALSHFHFDVLFVFGIGVVAGIVIMSRIIRYFLEHYRTATFASVIGFVIGSLAVVFPGWATSLPLMIISILAFAVGLLAAVTLGRIEYNQ
ncbi:DUF368 domain-containing protein [Lentibacillus saliphilus]|uniref:DUF368 domain-containing protein n=1 Tax=Lentibacillus saliphilus TaxID=2737028 RepID=UPI001C2F61C7|nr:DUF368 domain-containing protein [Lentibacillus saliphilus]